MMQFFDSQESFGAETVSDEAAPLFEESEDQAPRLKDWDFGVWKCAKKMDHVMGINRNIPAAAMFLYWIRDDKGKPSNPGELLGG